MEFQEYPDDYLIPRVPDVSFDDQDGASGSKSARTHLDQNCNGGKRKHRATY